MKRAISSLLTLAFLCSCGGKKGDSAAVKDDAASGPQTAPIPMPPSGVDKIARMNFVYGDGWQVYDKAVAAKAKKDWSAARTLAESSVGKDPYHLDAHRLLATILTQAGEHAAVVDHLVTALANDYWAYGPSLATDADLADFIGTQHGQAVISLAQKIRDDYTKRIANAVWLVGRRSTWKWPKEGLQPATTRGELYAYDRESRRYLRLTHTGHRVAGFARSASGTEVAVLGFDKIDRPKASSDAPGMIASAWVIVLDTTTWTALGPKVKLGSARELQLGYGAGDQLVVGVDAAVSSIDKPTGKLAAGATLPLPRISLSLEEGKLIRAPDGIEAAWSGEPPVTTSIKVPGGPAIAIPESGSTAQSSIALAPGGGNVAFSTWVDPCAKDSAPSLYVAETKKGALKHLLTSASRFATRWLDPATLAYEDGEGAIRLWDAGTRREALKLENKVGIALDVLSISAAPVCKATPEAVDAGSGAGSADEPLPPEEEPGGPVTAPQ
jgi:hypothetical protein